MSEDEARERQHRTFVNLAGAIAVLLIALAALWLLRFLEDSRKLQDCIEAGRRDCLQRFDPEVAPRR